MRNTGNSFLLSFEYSAFYAGVGVGHFSAKNVYCSQKPYSLCEYVVAVSMKPLLHYFDKPSSKAGIYLSGTVALIAAMF